MANFICRFCQRPLTYTFVDLGMSPLSNSYLTSAQLHHMEPFYPLHARVCQNCFLVQVQDVQSPQEIFSDYAYFSSYSESWLAHARNYAELMIQKLELSAKSKVIEIASNDGYLLQYFALKGIPVLGIEPAENVAEVAEKKGIPTLRNFFTRDTAEKIVAGGTKADLVLANNVLAHVPDLNDFVSGLKTLLKDDAVVTLEFPHLLKLILYNQFDTIYHEHFSYFSLLCVRRIFKKHELQIFDVDELPTHGGSLRIYAKKNFQQEVSSKVDELQQREIAAGMADIELYLKYAEKVRSTKRALLELLINLKRGGKTIVGYGAPAKGNTLLNYCAIRTDFIDFTVDRSPHKQGKFLPGTHIPIGCPDDIRKSKPDYILILPWNLREEIVEQIAYVRDWGGKFIIPIPNVEVLD